MVIPDANENTFRILVSTDNHVGYAEKDGLRGNDSFRSFEEVLNLAASHNVDFVLFAGDIFHDSHPSLKSVHEVIRLLRSYCHGNKPVQFEMLSDNKVVFANTSTDIPNYLDCNLNIGIPIFVIHGNHDEPSGPGGLCAADILHSAGLINLFGKYNSVEHITVNPILLRKGTTRLALYGLGAVRNERLHRLFLNNAVTFYRPTEGKDNWFSMCAVHQNRAHHSSTNYLPEHFLPDFHDLIIWGHEHECRIDPEFNSTQNFYVVQPGSSIATSLSEGESRAKAVALLEVKGKEFKVTKLPLKTVRPFCFRDIVLQDEVPKLDPNNHDIGKKIEDICTKIIESVINEATSASVELRNTSSSLQDAGGENGNGLKVPVYRLIPPIEPLFRLKIDTSGGFEPFNAVRFGQRFVGRVANPKDLVVFTRNREKLAAAQATRAERSGMSSESNGTPVEFDSKNVGLDAAEVEQLIRQYLIQTKGTNQVGSSESGLNVFTVDELEHSLKRYVDLNSSDVIQKASAVVIEKTLRHLRIRKAPEDRIMADIIAFCMARIAASEKDKDAVCMEIDNVQIAEKKLASTKEIAIKLSGDYDSDVDQKEEIESRINAKSKANTKKKRGTDRPTYARNAKVKKSTMLQNPFDSDEEEQQEIKSMIEDASDNESLSSTSSPTTKKSTRGRGRGRGGRGSTKRIPIG